MGRLRHLNWTTAAFAAVSALSMPVTFAGADVATRLGGGNVGRSIDRMRLQMEALRTFGAGRCRLPIHPHQYGLVTGKPRPWELDDRVRLACEYGIEPVLLFEFYTAWDIPLRGRDEWFRIGRAYAERFAPNSEWLVSQGITDWGVRYYSAINEPAQRRHNPTLLPDDEYANALEGLADGVHSIDAELKVSPGGWSEVPLRQRKHTYPRAVAPLFNAGKLHAICIHRYWDVTHVPMANRYDWSLQNQFDEVKREAGITANIAFCTDEVNVKPRRMTENEAARDFLTALWDALGVVGLGGEPITEFVMPWNVFHTQDRDKAYGLCTELSPWTPVPRGEVLRLVGQLTAGMEIVDADPKRSGEYVLEGDKAKLWVWQNRQAWTTQPAHQFHIDALPRNCSSVEVYGWDGLRRTVPAQGGARLVIDSLSIGETYMFLARDDASP